MLLPIEFQSAVDRYMVVRVLYYVAIAYHGLISKRGRAKRLAPGGLLPPVLAVTIYNGRKAWTAPNDVFDLIEPVQGWLSRRQPSLRHHVLDLRALARQPLPESNVVSWIARMERDSLAENVSRVVQEVLEKYPGPEHATLREAFREWVLGAAESWGIGGGSEAEVRGGDGRASFQVAEGDHRRGEDCPDRRSDHRVRDGCGTAGASPRDLTGFSR